MPASRIAWRSTGTTVERFGNLPEQLMDLPRRHAVREQLSRPAVPAVRREHGRDQVAGPGRPGEAPRPRPRASASAWHSA